MLHESGEIVIIGIMGDALCFKQHQANNPADSGAFSERRLHPEAG